MILLMRCTYKLVKYKFRGRKIKKPFELPQVAEIAQLLLTFVVDGALTPTTLHVHYAGSVTANLLAN